MIPLLLPILVLASLAQAHAGASLALDPISVDWLPAAHSFAPYDGDLLAVVEGEIVRIDLDALDRAPRPVDDLQLGDGSFGLPGEAPPLVSQGDLDRQHESGIAARALRLRVDWPLGLLRWHDGERETVGVVFRRHDGNGERYVVDLFDGATGSKLADDRVLFGRLPDRSSVSPVALADGSSLLAVVPGGNDATTLFRVALDLD